MSGEGELDFSTQWSYEVSLQGHSSMNRDCEDEAKTAGLRRVGVALVIMMMGACLGWAQQG